MAGYPTFSKEEKKKIEEEIRQNLFQLPNEEELQKNLEEVEYIKKLDAEYQQKKIEVENKRNQLAAQRLEKLEQEQQRLAARLESIINEPEVEDYEEKLNLIKKKKELEEKAKKDIELKKKQDLLKREHDIERKIKKKLELEKLIEKQKLLNKEYEQKSFQYEVIKEEQEMRNIENLNLIEKALKRKGMEEDISEKDKRLIAKNLVGNQVEDEIEVQLMLNDIQAFREQEKKQREQENKNKMKELNQKRFEYIEMLEQKLKEKAEHAELMKKGPDFMTEVAMGNAPPLEYIKRNLVVNEDEYRVPKTKEQIVKRTEQQLEIAEERLALLRKEQQEHDYRYLDEVNLYKGELKPLIARMNPESVFIARYIIDHCIDQVIKKEIEDKNLLDAADFKLKYLQEKQQKMQENDFRSNDQAIFREIRNKMLSKIYKQMAAEACHEIVSINNISRNIAESIIIRAIKQEKNTDASEDQLRKWFYDTRDKNTFEKVWPTNIEIKFTDTEDINQKRVKKKKPKKQQQINQSQAPDKDQDDDVDEDLDVIILYPEKDCQDSLGSGSQINKEIQYFKGWDIVNSPFLPHTKGNKKVWVTCMKLSFNRGHIGVGYNNGEVKILDSMISPAFLISVTVGYMKNVAIRKIEFPFDSLSQLMTVDDQGELKVYFNAQNLSQQKAKNKKQLPPMSYLEYYKLTWKHATRSRKRFGEESNVLKYTTGVFHPTITFTGLQPFILACTQNGTLLKYNTNKDIFKGISFKYPIHKVVNYQIITPSDTEYPTEYENTQIAQDNLEQVKKLGKRKNPVPHIFREFFLDHKAEIIFINFIESGERFISVDRRGYIFLWEYNKFYYGSNTGAFKPNSKNKINCEISTYKEANAPVQVYPQQNQKDIEREGKRLYNEIIKNKEYPKKLQYEKKQDKRSTMYITKEVQISDDLKQGDKVEFWKATVDYEVNRIIELFEMEMEVIKQTGYLKSCQSLPENKQILIEMILPHKIESNLQYVQFIRFDSTNSRLKKTKIKFEIPPIEEEDEIPFTVIDNLYPFNLPFLCVFLQQGMVVVSLSTGSIVAIINEHFRTLFDDLKSSKVLVNAAISLYDKALFLSTDSSDGVWKFEITDENPQSSQQEIQNIANDYFRLYIQ